jgi:hypothetical protein
MAKYLATSLAMEKVVSAPRVMSKLLADLDDLDQLGGVGVEIDHVAGFLGGLRAGVHGHAYVGLGQRGGVVGAVAGHGDELALGLLALDQVHLVLGLGLGEEVVDAGLAGDDGGGERIVAGDHDGADAHGAEAGEALLEAALDDVLEIDDAEGGGVLRDDQRRAAGRAISSTCSRTFLGSCEPCSSRKRAMASTEPLRMRVPGRLTPLMRVCAVKGTNSAWMPPRSRRAGCTSPWRARRWSGLRGFRRRARRAARRWPAARR